MPTNQIDLSHIPNHRCRYCEIDDDRTFCFSDDSDTTFCDTRGFGCPYMKVNPIDPR